MGTVTKNSTALLGKSPVPVLYAAMATEDVKPKKRQASWENGICSVCGQEGDTLPAGSMLGMTFGSWQEVSQHNTVSRLCRPCAWAFKDKTLLRSPIWIAGEEISVLDWTEAGVRLARDEVTAEVSVILPFGGRKIIAPYARYGKVVTDGMTFHWSPRYRKAWLACIQLDKVGIRGSLLSSDHAPTQHLAHLNDSQRKAVHDMWNYLSFVREDKTLRGLFTKLSMNIKGEKEQ